MANQAKLKSLLEKINWLYKSFEEHNFENVSSLETALLKEKVLMFYDEIDNLANSNSEININNESIKEVYNKSQPKLEVKENIIIKEPKPQEIPKIIDTEKANVVEIKKTTVIPNINDNNNNSIQNGSSLVTVSEKFKKSEAFNKQISSPKRDMREIIDLNKSFIFKAELFSQNNELYTQFINEMNTTQTEDDAFSVLITWTENQNWNTDENKAYDLLLRAVEKRFLPLI